MTYELSEAEALVAIDRMRALLQKYFMAHGLRYAVFGKSEGLDSSVIAGLFADLPGIQPVGVLMPCESKPEVETIAREVLDHFRIPSLKVDLTPVYQAVRDFFASQMGIEEQVQLLVTSLNDAQAEQRFTARKPFALGNIKVRLRMITLYHIAQLLQGVVISTDNFSEYWMGFWTLCGDVGDIAPIQQIFKGSELYTIAKVLGVPASSLNAVPSDGLGVTQNSRDEDQLGLPYAELDRVIVQLLQENYRGQNGVMQNNLDHEIATALGLPVEKVEMTANRLLATEFKRNWPIVFTREQLGLKPVEAL